MIELVERIEEILTAAHVTKFVDLAMSDGAARAWLHQRADILGEAMEEDVVRLQVRLSQKVLGQFIKTFPKTVIFDAEADDSFAVTQQVQA